MKRIILTALGISFCLSVTLFAHPRVDFSHPRFQTKQISVAERLGYARDAKLLIVHADDLGMAHSVNAATIKGFESGLVSSGSMMVPAPCFSEIASYPRANPQADVGL